jgi:hypothetical protein
MAVENSAALRLFALLVDLAAENMAVICLGAGSVQGVWIGVPFGTPHDKNREPPLIYFQYCKIVYIVFGNRE